MIGEKAERNGCCLLISYFSFLLFIPEWASQVVQWVENPPAVEEVETQETWVQSLDQEDPLEEATVRWVSRSRAQLK